MSLAERNGFLFTTESNRFRVRIEFGRRATMHYFRRHLDDRTVQRRWLAPRLFSVRATAIRDYLLAKGWKEVPSDQPGTWLFQEPTIGTDGPLHQWLLEHEQRRDYVQAIYELLAGVAEFEDRIAADVLTDILGGKVVGL